jgi:hypothetical protein
MSPETEIVLVALIRRTEFYLGLRKKAAPEPVKQCFVAPTPEPAPGVLLKDLELVEATGLTLEEVNQACVSLISEKKVKLINAAKVLVKQDGHLYELLPEPQPLPPMVLKVQWAIDVLKKDKFTDWEVYRVLKESVVIEQINAALQCLVQAGKLKCDAPWFSPTEAGYTYAIK